MACAPHAGFLQTALVKRFQIGAVEYVFCASGEGAAIVEQHQHMVAITARPGNIVQHHHHCAALQGQFLEQRHGEKLMAQIKMLQRLIQQIALR